MSSAVSTRPGEKTGAPQVGRHLVVALFGVAATTMMGCRTPGGLFEPTQTGAAYPEPPVPARLIQLGVIRDWQDVEPRPNPLAEWLVGPTLGKPVIQRPAGMCAFGGVLYMCDVDLATVYRVDFENRRMEVWPDPDRAIAKPVDLALGADESIFIADTDRLAVLQMNPAGKVLRVFRLGEGEPGQFRPTAVAVDGDSLYVANVAAHNVVVFNIGDGAVTRTIGKLGDQAGEFHFPADVVVANEQLYVLDLMNCRVQIFSREGQWQRSFGGPGNRPGFLGRPKRMAVGPDGAIFVADAALQRVHVFDAEGRVMTAVDGLHKKAMPLTLPNAVCVDAHLVPAMVDGLPSDFNAQYLLFVADQVADPRIEVYAYGTPTEGNGK